MPEKEIPFGDLKRRYRAIKENIDAALFRVLDSGWYILGKELEFFEQQFANYVGARHAIGVGSGTEALHLALVAAGVGPGDEVITVANTAVPTLSAISFAQARPVFVDIDVDSYCMDPAKIEAVIRPETKAIIPVHLYGHACDMPDIMDIADAHGLKVIEDCAQAHGSKISDTMVGTFGQYGCFSFYPSKNLGAFGDAGMIVTNDAAEADKLIKLRNYGQSKRYYHDCLGYNSRLDEIQAALLSAQLTCLPQWTKRRQDIAQLYYKNIKNKQFYLPRVSDGVEHVYHLFVVRHRQRDDVRAFLAEHGIGSQIHYPVPCHLQQAYEFLGVQEGALPLTEACAATVLSLPNYPELTDEEVLYVCDVLNNF
ncbi:DegT/DnrJ/EryC1/StrS family aminotransferase [candidate division KSB1 bacterium]|nr:DegT/DnrJ/EryC1/StrS family aminotransferase [candidate division KSB1 bacterium]RQW06295.1 MAG: DegT/DnrJ/EryC1/StrS family aminotransferase [candidate division KSB1 bacterium]